MKKIILALMAATSLASAMPAAAQDAPYNPYRAREAADARRIDWCVSTGAMSRREARALMAELRDIASLGGHSPRMRFYIYRRLTQLEREISLHCLRIHPPIYRQEYNRFPYPDSGPYRGHDRFGGDERGGRGHGYDGRYDGGPHDGRGQREFLQVR